MLQKLLQRWHVILWKPKRSDKFPYIIAQLCTALYLSTTPKPSINEYE